MSSSSYLSPNTIQTLRSYNACDISDALLKLKVPSAGFLPDLIPYVNSPTSRATSQAEPILVALVSTVLFTPKNNDDDDSAYPPSNIPAGEHWVDLTQPQTISVLSQPEGQKNAVLGGIMALRMKKLGALGVVVHGRIRDVEELKDTQLMVWAKATSTVGAGAESKAHAVNVPITISGVSVIPGDVIFCDPRNGVVVIPQTKVEEVLEFLPRLVAADNKVKEAVVNGMSVQQAFKEYRKGL